MTKHSIDFLLDHAHTLLGLHKRTSTYRELNLDSSYITSIRQGKRGIGPKILERFVKIGMTKELVAELVERGSK